MTQRSTWMGMILVRTNQHGKHMAYHQVDRTERRHIHRLRQAGKSNVSSLLILWGCIRRQWEGLFFTKAAGADRR